MNNFIYVNGGLVNLNNVLVIYKDNKDGDYTIKFIDNSEFVINQEGFEKIQNTLTKPIVI